MSDRDEFSLEVKETLAKRVGTLCSNPRCSTPTYGPSQTPSKSLSKGVAAHISAAAEGGPRYDAGMASEQRKSIDNGVWLCESCAKLIDTDSKRYSTDSLHRWKEIAEERALKALENPRIVNYGPDFADTILVATIQNNSFFPSPSTMSRRKITLKPIRAHRELKDVKIPIHLAADFCPKGYSQITLSCQNQGTGVEQYIKFEIRFEAGNLAILKAAPDNERVQLSDGGGLNSSFASFYIKELLPNEMMRANIVAKTNAKFDVQLWTQNAGQSKEVFIYEMVIGEEEIVNRPPWWEKYSHS